LSGGSARACWCGADAPVEFEPRYSRCQACGTLVAQRLPEPLAAPAGADAEPGFYGSGYWRAHQERDLGLPDIAQRARADLSGRCLHWLRVLLTHRLPPARVLDVGCGHGGFVALLRWAGFDASGLELSSWVIDFARRTFEVPVVLGAVEAQAFAEASFGVVVMNDVLEHLADPVATLRRTASLLEPDGVLIVQTPCAPEGVSHAGLVRAGDSFLKMLDEEGHLYLFSRRAVGMLLERAGLATVQFEKPFFGYDTYLIASRRPLGDVPTGHVEAALQTTPSGRMVLALLDKAGESESRRQRTIAQFLGPTLARRLAGVLRRLRLV